MAILKVDTITSADTPTVSITDGASISGVTTFSNEVNIPTWLVHSGDTNTKFGFEGPDTITFETAGSERLRIASDGKVGINDTSPEELLDLGESNQQNLKLGQRGYLGQGYSTGATILGHSVKAKTTGTTVGGMEVTESNSGGGAPSAIRMQSGNIEFHTAASGTSGAAFDSERLRIDEAGNANITGICTATSFALATSGKAFPCYEFSSWYLSSIFDPASADCFIENWAESNGPAYARLGTAPTYASGVWTPPSAGYWKMTAMVVYYHDTAVGDSGAHAIRVSTDSGSNYNNVSTTGFRIDNDANIKRTTVICASFKVATAATFRMGVYGIGVNVNQFRYMSGSQVDAGGCSLLIEKVAEIET